MSEPNISAEGALAAQDGELRALVFSDADGAKKFFSGPIFVAKDLMRF